MAGTADMGASFEVGDIRPGQAGPGGSCGGLPATELALRGPEGGEPRQDRQPGRGGQEAAAGTAGGPAPAKGGEPPRQPGHDVERPGERQGDQGDADRVDRGHRVAVPGGRGGHEVRLQAGGAPQRPVDRGQVQHQVPDAEREQRDDAQHPGGHHDPGAAPQAGDPRVPAAPGQHAFQDGGDAGEQVRHADQVTEDEIAVEADERHQLLQHLQVREGDDQEQDLGPRWPRRGRPGPA